MTSLIEGVQYMGELYGRYREFHAPEEHNLQLSVRGISPQAGRSLMVNGERVEIPRLQHYLVIDGKRIPLVMGGRK